MGLHRPDDMHCARTALVCIENTHNRCGGAVLSLAFMASLSAWAAERVRCCCAPGTFWPCQVAVSFTPTYRHAIMMCVIMCLARKVWAEVVVLCRLVLGSSVVSLSAPAVLLMT